MAGRGRQRHGGGKTVVWVLAGFLLLNVALGAPGLALSLAVVVGGGMAYRRVGQRRQEAKREQLWRQRISTLDGLMSLSPTGFEHAVADLLRARGWRDVTRVGGAGDLGADVIGVDPQGRLVVVQAKQYFEKAVGSPAIQMLIGAVRIHGADRGMLVTTSTFSRPAQALADSHGIVLVDKLQLADVARSLQPTYPEGGLHPSAEPQAPRPAPAVVGALPRVTRVVDPRWDQHHWRSCVGCRSKTRWRTETGQAMCNRCKRSNAIAQLETELADEGHPGRTA